MENFGAKCIGEAYGRDPWTKKKAKFLEWKKVQKLFSQVGDRWYHAKKLQCS